MGAWEGTLQLVLTFLPVLTVVVTIAAAAATRGRIRWIVLFAVPILGTALSWAALPLSGRGGNLLAVVLAMILWVGVVVYVPLLSLLLAVRGWRSRRRAAIGD